jgi:hypothetical protein
MGPEAKLNCYSTWNQWITWLHKQPGYETATPESLLAFQEAATGRDRYVLLDLIEDHVSVKGGTRSSMIVRLSRLRNFFLKNRVEIPAAKDWIPKPTRETTKGRLNVAQVKEIILHSGLRDQAIFLTMFQGMMDLERFTQFNEKYAEKLVAHILERGVDEPFRIDFPNGRKRNTDMFYTFIHRDALVAWEVYFKRERGWPKPGEPCAIRHDKFIAPSKTNIRMIFTRTAQKLKIKEKTQSDRSHRTGIAPHEMRDVGRSLLQTAVKDGFDPTCAEFFLGHSVDVLGYNKFGSLHEPYVLENAKISSKYLNILSGSANTETSDEMKQLMQKNAELEAELKSTEERIRSDMTKQIQAATFEAYQSWVSKHRHQPLSSQEE